MFVGFNIFVTYQTYIYRRVCTDRASGEASFNYWVGKALEGGEDCPVKVELIGWDADGDGYEIKAWSDCALVAV